MLDLGMRFHAVHVRLGVVGVLLAALGCAPRKRPAIPTTAAPLPAGVVASVGGETLALEALRRRVVATAAGTEPCPDGSDRCSAAAKALVERALEDEVNELLARHHAERVGLRVEPREVDAIIDSVAASAQLSKDEVLAAARRQELAESDYRRLIESQLLVAKVWSFGPGKDAEPGLKTEAEKRAEMNATYETWKNDPRHVRAEVRVLPFFAGEGREQYVSSSLTSLRDRAARGEDFCKLVSTYAPNDAMRTNCGSIGPMPITLIAPEIRSAIGKMKPLEVLGPLRVGEGMILLQLVDLPHAPPLEEVYREVWSLTVERVRREAVTAWLRGLGRGYGSRIQLSATDAAMLEAEVLRARGLRTAGERRRESELDVATEMMRNILRDGSQGPTR